MKIIIKTIKLSQSRGGRIALHLIAALAAGHWMFHLRGIVREL